MHADHLEPRPLALRLIGSTFPRTRIAGAHGGLVGDFACSLASLTQMCEVLRGPKVAEQGEMNSDQGSRQLRGRRAVESRFQEAAVGERAVEATTEDMQLISLRTS